ncbi:MAG: hypothetical protein AAGI09_10295 [Pseudomonadota bacterium]
MPDIIVAPAGGARFDLGGEIIMNAADMGELVKLTPGTIIATHMGAISHSPVACKDVAEAARDAGMATRILAPEDGALMVFS